MILMRNTSHFQRITARSICGKWQLQLTAYESLQALPQVGELVYSCVQPQRKIRASNKGKKLRSTRAKPSRPSVRSISSALVHTRLSRLPWGYADASIPPALSPAHDPSVILVSWKLEGFGKPEENPNGDIWFYQSCFCMNPLFCPPLL